MYSHLEVVGVVHRVEAVGAHYQAVAVQNHIHPVPKKTGQETTLSIMLPTYMSETDGRTVMALY